MKKRNFVAILMVAVGLFVSVNLFATNDVDSPVEGNDTKLGGGDVTGVYVPD